MRVIETQDGVLLDGERIESVRLDLGSPPPGTATRYGYLIAVMRRNSARWTLATAAERDLIEARRAVRDFLAGEDTLLLLGPLMRELEAT
jgi:hypothetical protein